MELTIHKLNKSGEGEGTNPNLPEDYPVLVPHTAPGDRLKGKIISKQKTYARALQQQILTSSPLRNKPGPPCPVWSQCGGCPFQHIQYPDQLTIKNQHVQQSLHQYPALHKVIIHPIIPMETPWEYRNKTQVPFGRAGQKVIAGLYAQRSHKLINLEDCPIQHPHNNRAVKVIRDLLETLNISVYDEKTGTGIMRNILIRTSFATEKTLIALVTNGPKLPRKKELVNQLRRQLPMVCGVVQNINTTRGNTILGPANKTLWGESKLKEQIGDLIFHLSPNSFYQVNPVQTRILYRKVLEYSGLEGSQNNHHRGDHPGTTLFDLYCGVGTISLYLAAHADRVVGVETVQAAVEDARKNAALNHITNTEFYLGKAEEVMTTLLDRNGALEGKNMSPTAPDPINVHRSVVVVDPPRRGCDPRLLNTVARHKIPQMVYVSCNPGTMARDLNHLAALRYEVREVQPIDMFPHTNHVECVCRLTREDQESRTEKCTFYL